MVTAARVLGDQVGSTAPVFLAFLVVHVLAGITAVITGAIAALVRKGSSRHIRVGRWYYQAITVVFATATALAAMRWRQDYYLFIIGAIAFTAATIGDQHRRRHRPGDTGHIAGMGIAYVAMLTAFYADYAEVDVKPENVNPACSGRASDGFSGLTPLASGGCRGPGPGRG